MNELVFSAVCAVICIHAVRDLNDAHRTTARTRVVVLLMMAIASFCGVFRPAMDEETGAASATALIAVMAADCMIRRYWRHLYHDRCDPRLVARLHDRVG